MTMHGYVAPPDLNEVIMLLAKTPGARILAGGQGLLVEPIRRVASSLLVDLRNVPGLTGLDPQPDGGLKIGAMVTLADISSSHVVRAIYPALGEAARVMGDAQLRNRATLGGHLASVDPEADVTAVVLALNANIDIVGPRGSRTIPMSNLITGPYQTMILPDEVLVAINVPERVPRSATAYERFRHPATLYALCGVSVHVAMGSSGRINACFVAMTGATEYPVRLPDVEKALLRAQPDAELIAASTAGEGLIFREDLFASAEYRHHLIRVLTERALKRAIKDARADIQVRNDEMLDQVAPAAFQL